SGLVPIRAGVQAYAALAFNDLAKLVGDDVLVGVVNGLLPFGIKLLDLLLVAANLLKIFPLVSGVGLLYFFERFLLGGIVGGADLVGAFEGHVLEHVGQARNARDYLR